MNKYLEKYSEMAIDNILKNYWIEEDGGRFMESHHRIFWEYTMVMLGFETAYKSNSNEELYNRIRLQFDYWMRHFDYKWITYTGGCNNPAADDAGWTSMAMVLVATKFDCDRQALKVCHDMIERSYDFWGDHNGIENGLYYIVDKDGVKRKKQNYAVSLIWSSLRYHEMTRGTDMEDKALLDKTLALYEWMEREMLRDRVKEYMGGSIVSEAADMLYYTDMYDNKETGEYFPDRWRDPYGMGATSMFGNMGMACIHNEMYKLTNDKKYLDRAVVTANAIAEYYNDNGLFKNDRDAWTNCTFIGYFVSNVMTLEGVSRSLGRMLLETVAGIMKNCYYEGGYYGGDWNGADRWIKSPQFGNPITIMTSANTCHMIHAARLADNLGLIDYRDGDEALFDGGYSVKLITDDLIERDKRFDQNFWQK